MKFSTRCIHAGQEPDPQTGAVNIPVHLSSTFKQDGIGRPRGGYEYSRTNNPSRFSLERTLAAIENGKHGLCFASGLAATTAVLNLLDPGDEILSTVDIYGGTNRLITKIYARYGVAARFLYTHSAKELAESVTLRTRLIWIETPTNPLLNIVDIAELVRLCAAQAAVSGIKPIIAVDNTFASPYFQTPLDLGADIVVHSTTKYLSGHSDTIGGAIVTGNDDYFDQCKFYQNAAGNVPSPFDCYLVQRGIKTLAVRMERHQANGFAVARFLEGHPGVGRVFFAGLENHPGHEIARKQMRGQPGMIAFTLRGGRKKIDDFFSRLKLIALAESLGGVESLVSYPFAMTHGSIPPDEKNKIGITEDLVRLSAGIEDQEDILADLQQALAP